MITERQENETANTTGKNQLPSSIVAGYILGPFDSQRYQTK